MPPGFLAMYCSGPAADSSLLALNGLPVPPEP